MKKIIYVALISLLPAAGFAGNQNDGNGKGPVSEYVTTHVMPVVAEKRRAFDIFLSATEKNELASLREQIQQIREGRRAAMLARQEKNADADRIANHEGWRENRAKMHELMEQVQVIADNHKDQLDKISNELAPLKEQWKSDISKIMASKENAEESGESYLSFSGNDYSHYGIGGRNKIWSRTGFLLLDASITIAGERMANALPTADAESMSIYPNPASGEFALNLSGIAAENKLIITDMTGKVIIDRENVVASQPIPCTDLTNGIYFVRLSTADNTINQKLIISR